MLLTSDPERRHEFGVMMRRRYPLLFSLPIALLVIIVSLCGLMIPGFYSRETLNWQAQSIGQDIIDLFVVVPALVVSGIATYRGNSRAVFVWGGVVIYLLYTFLIYCFGVHFNMLFPVYCITLGLAFYATVFLGYMLSKSVIQPDFPDRPLARWTGIYMLAIGVMFYTLWLMEIIPSIFRHEVPASLSIVGLPTNPVHVIDLAVLLPGVILTGVLLMKGRMAGYILAPVLLSFFVLMDITIAGLMVMLKQRGMEANPGIAAMMGLLAILSLVLLIFHLRRFKSTTG